MDIEVDEKSDFETASLTCDDCSLALVNEKRCAVEQGEMEEKFRKLKNRERVKYLTITYQSKVNSLAFLRYLPSLAVLRVSGSTLQTLDGIEELPDLKAVVIEFAKRRSIDITALQKTNIWDIDISYPTLENLQVINQCENLRQLWIKKSSIFDSRVLKDSKIEKMIISEARFACLGELANLARLCRVEIAYCNKLTSFLPHNENISYLEIVTCNSLDLGTTSNFVNLKSLKIRQRKKEFSLRFLRELELLEELVITACKVTLDTVELSLKKLGPVYISSLKRSELIRLSEKNRNAVFTNGKECYAGGIEREMNYYFEVERQVFMERQDSQDS